MTCYWPPAWMLLVPLLLLDMMMIMLDIMMMMDMMNMIMLWCYYYSSMSRNVFDRDCQTLPMILILRTIASNEEDGPRLPPPTLQFIAAINMLRHPFQFR